jgi:hypothetical protein
LSAELLTVVLAVLSDWRVIAVALLFLLASALLRYVGLVLSRERKRRLPAMRGSPKPKAASSAAKAAANPSKEMPDEGEEGDEMVV